MFGVGDGRQAERLAELESGVGETPIPPALRLIGGSEVGVEGRGRKRAPRVGDESTQGIWERPIRSNEIKINVCRLIWNDRQLLI